MSRPAPAVAVVVSRYNGSVTDRLLAGALEEYERRGGRRESVVVLDAPGSFELPALALAAARSGSFRAVVALGCIVRGETRHDRYLAQAVTTGLVDVTMRTGVPVGYGVLTVEKASQAHARAGGKKGNKGAESMAAALETVSEIDRLADGGARPVPVRAPDKTARSTG